MRTIEPDASDRTWARDSGRADEVPGVVSPGPTVLSDVRA